MGILSAKLWEVLLLTNSMLAVTRCSMLSCDPNRVSTTWRWPRCPSRRR